MKRKRFPGAVFGVLLAVFLILFIVVHLVDSDREEHGVKEAPGKTAEPGEAELTEEEGTDVVSIQDVPVYEEEAKKDKWPKVIRAENLLQPCGASIKGVSDSVSVDSVSDNEIQEVMSYSVYLTLEERQLIRSSYQETLMAIKANDQVIANSGIDFSNIKIACIGDSITEANNLDALENYRELSYPAVLGRTLQAEEVYNLGKGGSSIGRYWSKPFVDRYREIPEDADLILVMGGTNDGFTAKQEEFGSEEEREPNTFWGDLDELIRGFIENYPEAEVVLITPLPNTVHDEIKSGIPELIEQEKYADAIIKLAKEYGLAVIDLYNSNILDPHDSDNIRMFMTDGTHPNARGYEVLGEHIAAELISLLESRR